MVMGLLGEAGFMDVLIGLPNEFFKLHESTQDALWEAILAKINEGTKNIQELIIFALFWLELYASVKSSVHRAISKL
jgi:hypothetical protein